MHLDTMYTKYRNLKYKSINSHIITFSFSRRPFNSEYINKALLKAPPRASRAVF